MSVVHRPAAAALLTALLTAPTPTVTHAVDYSFANPQARTWVAACTSCHHADTAPGAKFPAQMLPPLAGRPQAELIDAMQVFRSGTRSSTVMGQIVRGYDDA